MNETIAGGIVFGFFMIAPVTLFILFIFFPHDWYYGTFIKEYYGGGYQRVCLKCDKRQEIGYKKNRKIYKTIISGKLCWFRRY